jgi:autotransporter-associated beta strand protein
MAVGLVSVRASVGLTIRADTPESEYQALAAEPQYAASGYIDAIGSQDSFGSATLIAPDWVLTSAHNVTPTEAPPAYPASELSFGLGPSTTPFDAGSNSVAQVVLDPSYTDDISQGNDLALLKLSTPITNVAPAVLYSSSLPSELNQTATIVGYGLTGTGLTGDSSSAGTRLAVTQTIDAFGGQTTTGGGTTYSFAGYSSNYMLTDFDEPGVPSASVMGGSMPGTLEGCPVLGDSGGGLYLTVNGQTYLAGVTTLTYAEPNNPLSINNDGHYGDVGFYIRLGASQSVSFIDSTLQTNSTWTSGSGTWASLANWTNQNIPEFQGATANFGNTSKPATVTLDGSWSVGTLQFNSSNSYTLAPGNGGSLTMDNGAAPAAISDISGSHFITAPVALNSNVQITTAGGSQLTISGNVSGTGGVTISGAGTLVLSGTNTFTGGTTLSSGATLRLAPNGGLTALSSLTLNPGSELDLTNNTLLINYGSGTSPISSLTNWVAGGQITSSSAAAANSAGIAPLYGVACVDGADGIAPGLSSGEIEIAPALLGDARLTGTVTFGDFQILSQYFGQSGGWDEGNFTYGSAINFGDFQVLSENFGQTNTLTTAEIASMNQLAANQGERLLPDPGGIGFQFTSVPEPASLTLLAMGGFGLFWRRRRIRSAGGSPNRAGRR